MGLRRFRRQATRAQFQDAPLDDKERFSAGMPFRDDAYLEEFDDDSEEARDRRILNRMIEAVDAQLESGEVPEAVQTLGRLVREGFPKWQARRLIAVALLFELQEMQKEDREYDDAKYTARLAKLPDLGLEDDEDSAG